MTQGYKLRTSRKLRERLRKIQMERGAGQQEMFGLTHTEDGSGKNRTGRANDPIQCHRDRTVVHLAVTNFCYDSERKREREKVW